MIQALTEILTAHKRLVAITALLLAVNLLAFLGINLYQQPAVGATLNRVNDLQKTVLEQTRVDVSTQYRQGGQDLEKLKERIPLRRHFPRVLGEVLESAAENGLTTGNVSYKPQALKQEKLLAYTVSLSASGSYAAVKSFLADLQEYRDLLVIDGFSLGNADPFEEHVAMDLRMTVYLQEGP